ncbi:SDR family NAD(P)-dependent oxidoreductase [Paenactinomyces guangxiensis]|uniref:SDR family NAD(P)-dependent oxidoreductase n=1 Tax=Paenactinomyces guangxiensis TaxID=1490290 RepID=A0A7W1WPC6_9BACL|nr:SDR family NAD(P)-dependent oxidoreductase [Paenactinomyces guangxiensis]MBA4493468.1 SDR family NAD(P)-dependent oxidoreductase [Paenactinomyces guangxiensis]MBH8590559.1 SDR family NAD(P)-dependent oxidoreductase [Paenactinomyces guangxiensis]
MNVSLNGKKILIVGASGILGDCLLRRLLEEGAIVGGTYYSQSVKTLTEDLVPYDHQLILQHVDASDPISIQKGLTRLVKQLGTIDSYIYNSGICEDALLPFMSFKKWKHVMSVNLDGAFLAGRIVSKEMIRLKKGKILHIASYKGVFGSYGQANYSASKAGMIALTKTMAKELGQFGISVNALCPGFMITNLNRNPEKKRERAIQDSVLSSISEPLEVVDFIIYLLSDKIFNLSGQVLHLDSRM